MRDKKDNFVILERKTIMLLILKIQMPLKLSMAQKSMETNLIYYQVLQIVQKGNHLGLPVKADFKK